ncbi:hypothetical protein ACOZ06_000385 [Cronobacter muytjensii]|uniref:Lipoprotein n=1 Tax=Cronobacter muytjensii TaxID=413501 RepID=A0A2T7B062_9ENTR|nr:MULTISPECIES: hypothetical protein [Cronobacter]ALB70778.1 hypothetical protein AFK63_09210 [Cronobacter muytjensii ATCC 51329]EGT4336994.1 hypothetical protein [Cronobacter muytjensii]EKS1844598.1 hypothetical protein [Cronobacter muytjensii]ELY2497334.1 hypothetical protein [Cronobacter muytjensii]ELY3985275.1 hypothetical protein [Cronobacter muytjensii]
MKKVLLLALGAMLLSGCSARVADMTVASTKNYNLNSNKFVKGARITGEDSAPVVIFPLGVPNVKTAMDRAIEKNRCAVALSDVVVTQFNHSFLFGKFGFIIEGTEVIDRSQPGCENAS